MSKRLIATLALLTLAACEGGGGPKEVPTPAPVETPAPVPTTAPAPNGAAYWKPGPIKSFQIFHFDGLSDFKKNLKKTDAVTIELSQMEEAGASLVVSHAHSLGVKVICYTSEGYEDWRDDAAQYPRDAWGKEMEDWDGERWGDPRKPSLHAFLGKRMDRCKASGADGIELDNMDQHSNVSESGINITKAENVAAQIKLAQLAHSRGLAIMAKNAGDIAKDLAPHFDGVYIESCHKHDECDDYKTYKGKPIAMVEYGLTSCAPFDGAVCQKKSGYFK
jgi:endo-alpha-1,4-polygalactosaminidase (GH114 family)